MAVKNEVKRTKRGRMIQIPNPQRPEPQFNVVSADNTGAVIRCKGNLYQVVRPGVQRPLTNWERCFYEVPVIWNTIRTSGS